MRKKGWRYRPSQLSRTRIPGGWRENESGERRPPVKSKESESLAGYCVHRRISTGRSLPLRLGLLQSASPLLDSLPRSLLLLSTTWEPCHPAGSSLGTRWYCQISYLQYYCDRSCIVVSAWEQNSWKARDIKSTLYQTFLVSTYMVQHLRQVLT